jgi:hypothetical protein
VFFNIFSEDELNYIHKLINQKLFWSINPFNLYGHIIRGIKPHMDRIKKEKPGLAEKLVRFSPSQAVNMMKTATRAGFPAYR